MSSYFAGRITITSVAFTPMPLLPLIVSESISPNRVMSLSVALPNRKTLSTISLSEVTHG